MRSKVPYLLARFEKHMVDSEYRLHFVPSMIKFHSPVKKREKKHQNQQRGIERKSYDKIVKVLKCNLLIGNLRRANIRGTAKEGQVNEKLSDCVVYSC